MEWIVNRTNDFELSDNTNSSIWSQAVSYTIQRVWDGSLNYRTDVRMLYSQGGIYFRFDCEDRKLSASHNCDNANLYEEDVVEVFLWPDESRRIYFEYEISPLGKELTLLIPNPKGAFMGWLPWHYEGDRKIRRSVTVHGGPAKTGAAISGWTASFFVPFALLIGLINEVPTKGSRWRGNLYRIDYDDGTANYWAGSPLSGRTFHDPERFGTLVFD